jgi:exopolysaccharide production protein ExoQ
MTYHTFKSSMLFFIKFLSVKLRIIVIAAIVIHLLTFVIIFNDERIYLAVLLIPLGIWLVSNVRWSIFIFVALLPLEAVLPGDILSLPKIFGLFVLIAWLIHIIIKRKKIHFDLSSIFMVIFILLGGISFFWSIDTSITLTRLFTYLQLLGLYLILTNQTQNKQDIEEIFLAIWIGSLILIISGVLQLVGLNTVLVSDARLSGITGNANDYMLWCVASLPSFYVAAKKGGVFLLVSLIGLVGLLVTSIFTQSRGGLVSLGIFFLIYLLFQRYRWKTLLLIVAITLLIWMLSPAEFWNRFLTIGNDYTDRFRDLWPVGWSIFLDNWFIGTGLGTNFVALNFRLNYLALIGSVHNGYLAIAMELGILGILLYLIFLFIPFLKLLTTLVIIQFEKSEINNLAVLSLAALAAILASLSKAGGMEYSKMIWLFLAINSFYGNQKINSLPR